MSGRQRHASRTFGHGVQVASVSGDDALEVWTLSKFVRDTRGTAGKQSR